MTDAFVQQPEEELYETLAPSEEEDWWHPEVDPAGQAIGALGDIAEAGIDIAGQWFQPRWPWDWRGAVESAAKMAITVRDLVAVEGKFAPPEAVEEPTTLEGRIEQRAQELLPKEAVGEDKAAGDQVLKALHFEQMTGEAAFVKFINWLGANSVEVAARSGTPLGMSLIYDESEQGALSLKPQFTGEAGKPLARVVDLRGQAGAKELRNYLAANWVDIPDLQTLVQQKISANWSAFMATTTDGRRPSDFGEAETNPDLFAEVMRQFGGFGDGTATLATVDDVFGGGSAVDIVGGQVAAAIEEFAAELSIRQNMIIIGQSIEEDEEGVSIGEVGFITSFDGTPYGDITSVNDLFSGGKLGQMDALPYMEALYANTKDDRGYSTIIEKIQQELFAWGLLSPGDDIEWGKLDISGMHGRADRTVDALQMFQADIINTALDVWEENPSNVSADTTPYIESVVQRLIARNLNPHDTQVMGTRRHEQQVLQEISRRIQDRVAIDPRRTMNDSGIKEVEATIQEMIGEMGSADRERYFGRGGSAGERQIVNSLMADFYQDANWGSQVFFGGNNSDRDFVNYAKNVGALTDEQMDLMLRGLVKPDDFRSTWGPNQLEALQAAEEDVVTSNLLKYISNYMSGDDIDANALRRGLITFAHTIGQRTASEYEYSDLDYGKMADKAIDARRFTPAESPLVSTFEDRLAESYNLVGGGDGPDFRRLMDSLERRRQPGTNVLRVRNV